MNAVTQASPLPGAATVTKHNTKMERKKTMATKRKPPKGYEERKAKREKIAKEVSKEGVLPYLKKKRKCK